MMQRGSFALVRERSWLVSPTTHINAHGPAFIPPRSWPRWVWNECACGRRQFEFSGTGFLVGDRAELARIAEPWVRQ